VRGRFLKQSHKNLLNILNYEKKFFDSIEKANKGEKVVVDTDSDTISSDNIEKFNLENDVENPVENGVELKIKTIEEKSN
jgi:hypothetical protein